MLYTFLYLIIILLKKKNLLLEGNLSNEEVKGKRYCNLKNQADEKVFVLAIVALVVNEG